MLELQTLNTVELGKNYLRLTDKNTSDQDLSKIFNSLSYMAGCSLFWLGDFLCAVEERKGENYAKAYTLTDYAPGTLWVAKSVCKKLPPEKRVNLSYSHHKESLVEAHGDPELALQYLKQAEAKNQSVSQMRKEIRLSLASTATDENKDTILQQDSEFLAVMDAFVTLRRFLENTTSKTFHVKRGYVLAEIEELNTLAQKVCK